MLKSSTVRIVLSLAGAVCLFSVGLGKFARSSPDGMNDSEPQYQHWLKECKRHEWDRISSDDLRRSLLPLSHILIRHERSAARTVPLSLLDWTVELPGSERSPSEARELALRLAGELKQRPENFEKMVVDYSDDPVTRPRAGRIGVVPASEFALWPWLLDCLVGLEPGETSHAVESDFGFHVFRIDALPEPETFEARRLVIGHAEAPFLQYSFRYPDKAGAREAVARRSREKAFRIAEDIHRRSQADSFESLIQNYSEHRDAIHGGDLGQWHTHEASAFPLA